MKIAICDDELQYINEISSFLQEYFRDYPQTNTSTSFFSTGEELLKSISEDNEYDICFLDIIMPGMNGISLGRALRSNGYTGIIIYLTSSPEYAIDSYRVRAHDYLLKPINKDDLFSTMDIIISNFYSRKEVFTIIKTKDGSVKVNLQHIMYIRLSNRSVHYHLTNGSIIQGLYIRTGFTDAICDVLAAGSSFALCGSGMAANLEHLSRLEDNHAFFCNNKYVLHVGIRAFRSLKAAWMDYCINKEV